MAVNIFNELGVNSTSGAFGAWTYAIKGRELLIKNFSEVNPEDSILKKIAKTSFNAALRITTTHFSSLPNIFQIVTIPYCSGYGFVTNLSLAAYKVYQAVKERDLNKAKDAIPNIAYAALELTSLSPLISAPLYRNAMNTVAYLYSAGGILTDLTNVSRRIHDWMFPIQEAPHVVNPQVVPPPPYGQPLPVYPAPLPDYPAPAYDLPQPVPEVVDEGLSDAASSAGSDNEAAPLRRNNHSRRNSQFFGLIDSARRFMSGHPGPRALRRSTRQ